MGQTTTAVPKKRKTKQKQTNKQKTQHPFIHPPKKNPQDPPSLKLTKEREVRKA